MDAATLSQLNLLLANAPSLFASRYLASKSIVLLILLFRFLPILFSTVAAAVITLWDHLLTLTAEIELIWRGKFDFFKVIFIINRYFVEGTLIYVVYGKSAVQIQVLALICSSAQLCVYCGHHFRTQSVTLNLALNITNISSECRSEFWPQFYVPEPA